MCGDRLLALGREHGRTFYQAVGGVIHGWALTQIHDGMDGLEELRSSRGRYSAGIKTNLEVYRAGLVEAELRAGERASASLFGIETGGAKYWGAELLRLRGDIQRSGPDREEARQNDRIGKPSASGNGSRQSRSNCAPRRASRVCGATRANGTKRAIFSPRSTVGSQKASKRST